MSSRDMSDEAFMRWCENVKPCTFCRQPFAGPVCPCEWERLTPSVADRNRSRR